MADITDKNPMMADSSRTVTMADIADRNTLVTITIVEDASDKELVDYVDVGLVGPNLDIQSMGISQDSDSDISEASSTSVDQEPESVNPLILPVISSCLFDYMDVGGLKNARLVCKAWANAGAAKLIKKATLYVDAENEWHSFSTIMGQTSTNPFQKYIFKHFEAHQWERIFNSTGQHIKAFWPVGPKSNVLKVGFLRSILLECFNLEELIIFCPEDDFTSASTKLWLPQDKKLTVRLKRLTLMAVTKFHSNILMELLNACPELTRLRFASMTTGACSEFAKKLLTLGESGKINLEKLNELSLGYVDKDTVGLFRRQKLNLSFLEIFFMSDLDKVSVEAMLEHLSGTLKSFTCDNFEYNVTFRFTFPASMTKLAKIEIRTNNNGFFVEAIKSAMKLPSLNILLLSGPGGTHFNNQAVGNTHVQYNPDLDTCWRLMELDVNTERCLSLKTLQIPFGLTNGQILNEIATVFPNVTDLRLHHPSEKVIAAVFAIYKNLERLSIKMQSFPPNLDSVLTGLKTKWCKSMLQKKKFKFVNPAEVTYKRPGLKDMKRLKYFELREDSPSSHLTEITLYHGLAYLTRAVQIDLQGCQELTEGGIEELKSSLGHCCFVNINREVTGGDNFWWQREQVQFKFL